MGRDRMDGTVELDKIHMEGTRKVCLRPRTYRGSFPLAWNPVIGSAPAAE